VSFVEILVWCSVDRVLRPMISVQVLEPEGQRVVVCRKIGHVSR